MMKEDKRIPVEVAYAKPDQQLIINLEVEPGTTAIEAIKLSGIKEHFPEINLENAKIGIFSKICKADTELREKDRVEIYRPLIADPKESRRKRAQKKEDKQKEDKKKESETSDSPDPAT